MEPYNKKRAFNVYMTFWAIAVIVILFVTFKFC